MKNHQTGLKNKEGMPETAKTEERLWTDFGIIFLLRKSKLHGLCNV